MRSARRPPECATRQPGGRMRVAFALPRCRDSRSARGACRRGPGYAAASNPRDLRCYGAAARTLQRICTAPTACARAACRAACAIRAKLQPECRTRPLPLPEYSPAARCCALQRRRQAARSPQHRGLQRVEAARLRTCFDRVLEHVLSQNEKSSAAAPPIALRRVCALPVTCSSSLRGAAGRRGNRRACTQCVERVA